MNGEKLRFKVKETRFIGHVLSANGVHIDPRKVEAIGKMPVPTNVAELRRFLGMVQYLSVANTDLRRILIYGLVVWNSRLSRSNTFGLERLITSKG
jgi:hypothetical protein